MVASRPSADPRSMSQPRPFFYRESHGIRITVRPSYAVTHSHPSVGQYVFTYAVRIENIGKLPAQLLTRRWLVHDSIGEDSVHEGEGVIGEQPVIAPGQVHEYQSYCILKSPSGFMEGHYHFIRSDGSQFDAAIPRFTLAVGEGGGVE
jgi:ApaG protein